MVLIMKTDNDKVTGDKWLGYAKLYHEEIDCTIYAFTIYPFLFSITLMKKDRLYQIDIGFFSRLKLGFQIDII